MKCLSNRCRAKIGRKAEGERKERWKRVKDEKRQLNVNVTKRIEFNKPSK